MKVSRHGCTQAHDCLLGVTASLAVEHNSTGGHYKRNKVCTKSTGGHYRRNRVCTKSTGSHYRRNRVCTKSPEDRCRRNRVRTMPTGGHYRRNRVMGLTTYKGWVSASLGNYTNAKVRGTWVYQGIHILRQWLLCSLISNMPLRIVANPKQIKPLLRFPLTPQCMTAWAVNKERGQLLAKVNDPTLRSPHRTSSYATVLHRTSL